MIRSPSTRSSICDKGSIAECMAEEDGEEFEWWWWWWWWWWKKREEDGGGEGSRKWGLVYLALGGWAAQVNRIGKMGMGMRMEMGRDSGG
ncbi:hypothetical protein OIU85_000928 [Salix viminalis]|uniref:Uncharacterized protein n=1 Tax=Salix viminalis TaxID=40686 RepID=A0A9Q0ZXF7_SALVM|nr:hypothetical protein OIU85_000928 [Salix viminalis]